MGFPQSAVTGNDGSIVSSGCLAPFDELRVRKIVTQLVFRKLGMFAGLPEFAREDLISEGMMAARAAWSKYDFWRATASTFVYMAANRRLISIWRSASADRRRGRTFALESFRAGLPDGVIEAADADEADTAPRQPLERWAAGVAMAAREAYKGHYRKGERFYRMDQIVALGALMRHARISSRHCQWLLTNSPDLRKALGIDQVPTYRTIHRAGRRLNGLFTLPVVTPQTARMVG